MKNSRVKSKTYVVYCESIFCVLHSKELKGIHHWEGPTFISDNKYITPLHFYTEEDAKKAISIIKSFKCKLYGRAGSKIRNNLRYEEIKY